MTELYLVRHGATAWSVAGRHTGHTDIPLLPEGQEQARRVAPMLAGLEFDLVLSSPLQRARQTAAIAGFAAPELDPDLMEWNYGDYEGLTTPQIRSRVAGWNLWEHPTPGGETAEQVAARLDRVVKRVRSAQRPVRRAVIFAHGHCLRALAARWLGQPVSAGQWFYLDTATVSVLGFDRERPVVRGWNQGS